MRLARKTQYTLIGLSMFLGLCLVLFSVFEPGLVFHWPLHNMRELASFGLGVALLISGILFGWLGCSKKQAPDPGLENCLNDLKDAQEQLILQEKLAQVGLLTAGIAHEIKNPLNFVTNFSRMSIELVLELETLIKPHLGALEANTRQDLDALLADLKTNSEKIHMHGKRAENIVMSMLIQSRSDAELQKENVTINDLAEEYLNLAYHGLRAKDSSFNVKIEKHLDENAGQCFCIGQSIGRVILNILNNGMYATFKKTLVDPSHHPIIIVSTEGQADHVIIRIRDNGPGIKDEHLKQIFKPFFTTKPKGQGTGLGLSICHDIIVKDHHGTIEVDSKFGEFTEFQIKLPRHDTKKGNL